MTCLMSKRLKFFQKPNIPRGQCKIRKDLLPFIWTRTEQQRGCGHLRRPSRIPAGVIMKNASRSNPFSASSPITRKRIIRRRKMSRTLFSSMYRRAGVRSMPPPWSSSCGLPEFPRDIPRAFSAAMSVTRKDFIWSLEMLRMHGPRHGSRDTDGCVSSRPPGITPDRR